MIYISKQVEEDTGLEWVSADDYLSTHDEYDMKVLRMYTFLDHLCKIANYFNINSTTVNGNPELDGYEGWVTGYCTAMGWRLERTPDKFVIYSSELGNRRLVVVERPKIPESEIENRKFIKKLLDSL